MPSLAQMSAAGTALSATAGLGDQLKQEVVGETEEVRHKRMQAAQRAGYSPAGRALAIDYGTMSVPGAEIL
jgi:hypothetical protein